MFLARRLMFLVTVAGIVAGGLAMSRGEQPDKDSAGAGSLTDGFETPQRLGSRSIPIRPCG